MAVAVGSSSCSVPSKEAGGESSSSATVLTTTDNSSAHPVPSITLSIAQDDVRRVLEASKALKQRFEELKSQSTALRPNNTNDGASNGTVNGTDSNNSNNGTPGTSQDGPSSMSPAGKTNNNDVATTDANDLDPPLRTVSAEDDDDDSPKNSTSSDNVNSGGSITDNSPVKMTSTSDTGAGEGMSASIPSYELVYEAARQCDNSMLRSFLDKMKHSGSTPKEIRAGVLVFSDMDLDSKIQYIFDILQEYSQTGGQINVQSSFSALPTSESSLGAADSQHLEKKEPDQDRKTEPYLTQSGVLSMFRAVIVAISSCIHKNERFQIEIDENEVEEPSAKRMKRHHGEKGTDESIPSIAQTATTSFDSTVATLKEEDEDMTVSPVRKEFEDIANYAAERLVKYAQKKTGRKTEPVQITYSIFQDWRFAEGAKIAPWLSMLDLSKWTSSQRSNEKSVPPKASQPPQKSSNSVVSNESAVAPKSKKPGTDGPVVKQAIQAEPPTIKPSAKSVPDDSRRSNGTVASSKQSRPKEEHRNNGSKNESFQTQTPVFVNPFPSKPVLSFDFAGSLPEGDAAANAYAIVITEENLATFRNLVTVTGLRDRSCEDVARIIMGASRPRDFRGSTRYVLPIDQFHTCLNEFMGSGSSRRLTKAQREVFSSCFVDFFSCFNTGRPPLQKGEADTEELSIGLCFVCAGNKSSKLAAGFDIMEKRNGEGLTNQQLTHFLKSYLIMLVGISLLTSSPDGVMKPKMDASTRRIMLQAVEHGARWTLRHFLDSIGIRDENDTHTRHTFETFARWYSDGGYNVAPWLELLSLEKLLALVVEKVPQPHPLTHEPLPPSFPAGGMNSDHRPYLSPRRPPYHAPPPPPPNHTMAVHPPNHPTVSSAGNSAMSHHSGINHHNTSFGHQQPPPPAEILFTFPLANKCSLVILKEDATYVRGVVDQLSMLTMKPDEVWAALFGAVTKRLSAPTTKGKKSSKNHPPVHKTMQVDKATFVGCMLETIQSKGGAKKGSKKRSASGSSKTTASAKDVLANFFQSFDLMQNNSVTLNELMGGLILLCGGKKSTKLSFAFSVFDRRPSNQKRTKKGQSNNSLDGEELFLFLRSFLIVMFSCCRQSWSLTDDLVNRYIADTANMVTDDVMRYQWQKREKSRIDFDEFGQWYNEGGFETAPWLELLDLKKWVLQEQPEKVVEKQPLKELPPPLSPGFGLSSIPLDPNCPPPPPDADMDLSFLDDDNDGHPIKPMDSVDEVELFLMQQTSSNKDDPLMSRIPKSPHPFSPKLELSPRPPRAPPVKFHLVTNDSHAGYQISVSQTRIAHLRQILNDSGLFRLNGENAAKEILSRASRQPQPIIKKSGFDSAMRNIVSGQRMSLECQQTLSDLLNKVFAAFDNGTGKAYAVDVACGFTVLCQGKKSDKLEFAFDLLDRKKQGNLSRAELKRYLGAFLTVLMSIVSNNSLESDFSGDAMTTMNGEMCERSPSSLARAVDMGCQWASMQAIRNAGTSKDKISFDHFADWYTSTGYSKIPWLELLDLSKWIMR